VTINSGALFSFVARGNQTLAQGTVFTVINNTSANPIAGTFANLLTILSSLLVLIITK